MSIHNFFIQFAVLYAPLMHVPTEQIKPYLFRGPDPKVADIYALHDKGIKTIISLRTNPQEKKKELCDKLGMKWIVIKTGVFKTPSDEQFDQFRAILDNKANYPIYTSCEINMDRTAVYLAAWQRTDEHWTAQQVTDEWNKHHMKKWWPVFRKYHRVVEAYADKVNGVSVSTSAHANEVDPKISAQPVNN